MPEENNRAESAIDVIYSLSLKIENLDKKITIIDSNIKLLNNKVSKMTKLIGDSGVERLSSPDIYSEAELPRNVILNDQDSDGKLVLGNVSTFGYIIDHEKKPIEGVSVNVYDSENDLIKDVTSNRDGYWVVRLPPGKYLVKYIMEGFRDIKRIVELTKEMKKYEVK